MTLEAEDFRRALSCPFEVMGTTMKDDENVARYLSPCADEAPKTLTHRIYLLMEVVRRKVEQQVGR